MLQAFNFFFLILAWAEQFRFCIHQTLEKPVMSLALACSTILLALCARRLLGLVIELIFHLLFWDLQIHQYTYHTWFRELRALLIVNHALVTALWPHPAKHLFYCLYLFWAHRLQHNLFEWYCSFIGVLCISLKHLPVDRTIGPSFAS